MTENRNTAASEWKNLMNGLANSVASAPGSSIDEELRAEGQDPKRVADDVRATLLNAVADAYRDRRQELQRCQQERRSVSKRIDQFAGTLKDKLAILSDAFKLYPQAFTLQGREFSELTEADASRLLDKLKRLGVLDKIRPCAQDGEERGE